MTENTDDITFNDWLSCPYCDSDAADIRGYPDGAVKAECPDCEERDWA